MSRWHGPQGKGASRERRTRPDRSEAEVLAARALELAALRARITDHRTAAQIIRAIAKDTT